jgi:hypothetical protein
MNTVGVTHAIVRRRRPEHNRMLAPAGQLQRHVSSLRESAWEHDIHAVLRLDVTRIERDRR